VASSQVVDESASVNFPCTIKVQQISSGTGSPGWSWKEDWRAVVCVRELLTRHSGAVMSHENSQVKLDTPDNVLGAVCITPDNVD